MISAKVIAYSINSRNKPIVTLELIYPRFIHSEVMTHRLFSRNAQSSRAVPVKTALELLRTDHVTPIVWGKNKAGMSSVEELSDEEQKQAEWAWSEAVESAVRTSQKLVDIGLHKQWSNRITEPFSHIKVIVTATEWDNFLWLRDDPDAAQPEIVELAREIKKAILESKPVFLHDGFWHMPYVHWEVQVDKLSYKYVQVFYDSNGLPIDLDTALKISASCCAQVSYRRLDDSLEKALDIYNKLFSGPKPHMSPTEHQAMCFVQDIGMKFTTGITHIDKYGNFWSNNFKGWIQHRALIEEGTASHLV